ncbi:MAG TPA: class I SAM-dependent methyltransferase family protein [Acidimicrobiales bacterium]|nr:class I SAM-dependent methyltransferase family protein [Acidimicrobiales bacterium]
MTEPKQRDWAEWHKPYDDEGSYLSRRLAAVKAAIAEFLDRSPAGPIRVLSVCAGEGRDLLEVLPGHPRRADVSARLVELDPRLVERARAAAAAAGLDAVEVVEGDASPTTAYDGIAPADLLLVCGVFGNISEADIEHTVRSLPSMCRPGATVVWTRHRVEPDVTPSVRGWFVDAGFEELSFTGPEDAKFGVGVNRLTAPPQPFVSGLQLFEFVGDGADANR